MLDAPRAAGNGLGARDVERRKLSRAPSEDGGMKVQPAVNGPARPAPVARSAGAASRSFLQVIGEGARPPPAPARPPPPDVPPAQPSARGGLRALAVASLEAERGLDAALRAARAGRTFSPAELLALQATAFRYSQAVEILSRGADRIVGAVKQAMGTQV